MKVLICGLGSMGKRRLRLLKEYDSNLEIFGVDSNSERAESVSKEFNIIVYDSLEKAYEEQKPSCLFVCTSPLAHYSIIKQGLNLGMNNFTEINVVADGYEELISLAKEKNLKLFLSSTMNYKPEIKYFTQKVNGQKVSYNYHVGQYLPDWHPWENYKSFFVNDKRTNGCREILAIQMPWLVKCFGEIEEVKSINGTISELNLNYPDTIIILIKHKNGNMGTFFVDVVARKPVTNLTIEGNDLFITWKGSKGTLFDLDLETKELKPVELYESTTHVNGYSNLIIEEPYLEEIKEFFNYVENNKTPLYTFEDDKTVLDWIDKMEEI